MAEPKLPETACAEVRGSEVNSADEEGISLASDENEVNEYTLHKCSVEKAVSATTFTYTSTQVTPRQQRPSTRSNDDAYKGNRHRGYPVKGTFPKSASCLPMLKHMSGAMAAESLVALTLPSRIQLGDRVYTILWN